MAIDDIKPAGTSGQADHSSSEVAGDGKPGRKFAEVQRASAGPGSAAAPEGQLASFHKADLDDPAKADLVVRAYGAELVNSQTANLPLSNGDKKALTDFVSEDPLLRQKIETYLRKALP